MNISFSASGSTLRMESSVKIAQASVGVWNCVFSFDDTWDVASAKYAYFQYGDANYYKVELTSENIAGVPQYVIAKPYFKVSLKGTDSEGTTIITTNVVKVPVEYAPQVVAESTGIYTATTPNGTMTLVKSGDNLAIDIIPKYKEALDNYIAYDFTDTKKGYYHNKKFYTDTTYATEIECDDNNLYVDLATQNMYYCDKASSAYYLVGKGYADGVLATSEAYTDAEISAETQARTTAIEALSTSYTNFTTNITSRMTSLENKEDSFESSMNSRFTQEVTELNTKFTNLEYTINSKADEKLASIEESADEKLLSIQSSADEKLESIQKSVDEMEEEISTKESARQATFEANETAREEKYEEAIQAVAITDLKESKTYPWRLQISTAGKPQLVIITD